MESPAKSASGNGRTARENDAAAHLEPNAVLPDPDGVRLRLLSHEMQHWKNSAALTRAEILLSHYRAQISRQQQQLRQLRAAVRMMQESKFWQIRNAWFAFKKRRGLLKGPVRTSNLTIIDFEPPKELDDPYAQWRSQHAPREADIARMRAAARHFKLTPVISILMPTYNTPETMLRGAIESVIAQAYPFWELCIADDASPDPLVRKLIASYCELDPRIKAVFRTENGHISRSSNSALEIASGEYVGLLDHDDLLTPDALFEVVSAINTDPAIDMIYSDEDKVDEDGGLSEPYFKPDWSPDSMLGRNYTCHFAVFRRSLMTRIGAFRPEFDGSQDYDLVLRFSEVTEHIHHIPQVLYHWRRHSASAASNVDAKGYAYLAGQRAIEAALERRGELGAALPVEKAPGAYVVRFSITRPGKVSIIVPTRDHPADVDRCLTSIFDRQDYADFEVILLDNGSRFPDSLAMFQAWEARDSRVRVVRYDVPFNYSKINNYAAARATGEYLLFLNNDTEVITNDWLAGMIEWAQRPAIGAVGAKLLFDDNTIQHAGVIMGIGGVAGHSHKLAPRDANGYFNMLLAPNNYSAVTAACLMTRTEVFNQVNGFDEDFGIAFNDVDLCLRIRGAGYRIVCLPNVELYHYESKSRGYDDTPEKVRRSRSEQMLMQQRWWVAGIVDPYYSPHLSLLSEDFSIRL